MKERSSAAASRDVLAKLFRSLGDPSRLSILLALREGPRCVSEIASTAGLSQPNASMHLACLWACGLVEREPQWRSVYYRIASSDVDRLLAMAADVVATNGPRIECCPRYRTSRPGDASGGRVARPSVRRRVRATGPASNAGVK